MIFVTGWIGSRDAPECGAFEINPDTGASRVLLTGASGGCGGAEGPVSPNGKLVASYSGKQLSLLDLETRAAHVVKGVSAGDFVGSTWMSRCSWSPDGHWLAAVRDGRIVLIDPTNFSQWKSFRASPSGPVYWSPDSKYLLFARSQFSCIPYLYTESLEAIEVASGRKIPIKSSHCAIVAPVVGWLDPARVQ
jgi:hypothetical protein